MTKFNCGDLVRIRNEWKDRPEENHLYRVVSVNEVTNRYCIECLTSGLRIAPTELVEEHMIEKPEDPEDLYVYIVYFNGNDQTEVEAACEDEAVELAKEIAAESGEEFELDFVECICKCGE